MLLYYVKGMDIYFLGPRMLLNMNREKGSFSRNIRSI